MLGKATEMWCPSGPITGGAWLSSARVVRCWVKSRNERNPCSMLSARNGGASQKTNAFNLIDGLDGLAVGVGIFATATAFLSALLSGNIALALLTAPLLGALLGFLPYNFNPASIFMGDCGSLTVGFLLGCFGVIWSAKAATVLGMTAPLIALAIPLLDTALAISRRFLRHQPIFGADRRHIHHRLLARGFTPRRVAYMIYASAGVTAALALLLSSSHAGGVALVLFCVED